MLLGRVVAWVLDVGGVLGMVAVQWAVVACISVGGSIFGHALGILEPHAVLLAGSLDHDAAPSVLEARHALHPDGHRLAGSACSSTGCGILA
jgi:hypothetical protein